MPFRFVCHNCGAVLLEEQPTMKELNHARKRSYVERVAERLGGKCSVCGAPLQTVPTKIEVKPRTVTCPFCRYTWTPINVQPRQCPKCKKLLNGE